MPGFSLPPGINDGAFLAADHFAIPHPGFGIDGLSHRAQESQTVELVPPGPLLSPFDEGSDRGGSGIENTDLMTVDDPPEAVWLGAIRRAFVHDAGRAILQWAINDVAVSGDPTDIGGAPVSVFFFEVEDPFGGYVSAHRITASGVNDSLRFTGCSRGVQNVQRMLGIERFGGAFIGDRCHQFVPPVVASGVQSDWRTSALIHDHVLDGWAGSHRFFDGRKQFDFRAAAV